jgi:hypothetical protein
MPNFARPICMATLSVALLSQQARALVTLNDGTDKIFVTGSVNVSRDSNIFASREGGSDYVYNGGVGVEYTRKAGWIGVNAGVGLDISRFDKFSGENFQNPRFSAEFNKQTGRTTGALNLNAARQSRADAALNSRNTSWNYGASLNLKYPVIERYTLSGGLGYNQVKYVDNPAFVDLASYSANLNLYYILSNDRDLFAGYRYRLSETSKNTSDTDHGINAGISGKILSRVNGSVNVGYQVRKPSDDLLDSSYKSWTSAATVSYAFNKKTTLSGQVGKDFSNTALDTTLDSLLAGLELQYAHNAKLTLSANLGYGRNDFLGQGGLIFGTNIGRVDTSFDWGARIGYTFSQHLSLYLAYTYTQNWSNSIAGDYERSLWSAGASSRW